jgi:hypothetical protein
MRYLLALMLTLNLLGDFAVDATAIASNLSTAMPPPPSLYLSLPLPTCPTYIRGLPKE